MAKSDLDRLADQVRKHYEENPDHEISHVAEALGEPPALVTQVLDEYRIEGGKAVHKGPGRGGGWLPESEAA